MAEYLNLYRLSLISLSRKPNSIQLVPCIAEYVNLNILSLISFPFSLKNDLVDTPAFEAGKFLPDPPFRGGMRHWTTQVLVLSQGVGWGSYWLAVASCSLALMNDTCVMVKGNYIGLLAILWPCFAAYWLRLASMKLYPHVQFTSS